MTKKAIEIGLIGRNVAANLAVVRGARRLSIRALAEQVTAAGRPISYSGITAIENQRRRVDVDDLVMLAAVLGVTPDQLMAHPSQLRVNVEVTKAP